MPLTADWLQFCFGTRPWLVFFKKKNEYPTFKLRVMCENRGYVVLGKVRKMNNAFYGATKAGL